MAFFGILKCVPKEVISVLGERREDYMEDVPLPDSAEELWDYLQSHRANSDDTNVFGIMEGQNPYLAPLVYKSLRRVEQFLQDNGYLKHSKYYEAYVMVEYTPNTDNTTDTSSILEGVNVNLGGFTTQMRRWVAEEILTEKMHEDAEKLRMVNLSTITELNPEAFLLPESAVLLEDAVNKLRIDVPNSCGYA